MDAPAADLRGGFGALLELGVRLVEALVPQDLDRTVTIRGEALLVVDALNRSVTQTVYHVGQIVYASLMPQGNRWIDPQGPPRGNLAREQRDQD
jgi:hypothetical protein